MIGGSNIDNAVAFDFKDLRLTKQYVVGRGWINESMEHCSGNRAGNEKDV